MRIRLRFRLFLLRKKSASIAFWYQNAMLAGKTLTPMPPVCGELMVELRHKSEMHIGAAIRSAM